MKKHTIVLVGCVALLVAACGGSDDAAEPSLAPTDATTVATDAPATDPPATDPPATDPPATDPPATDPPATDPPATEPPPTTEPAPPLRAVGLVPLPGSELDFTGQAAATPSLVWSLYSGSGGVIVENVGGPLPPGCHGTSFFDPTTFELLLVGGNDANAYATRGDGGCANMRQDLEEGVIDGPAVAINTDDLIVFDFGALPDGPFDVSTQIVDPDGADGVFRASDPSATLFDNDLTGATHVVGADVLLEVDAITGDLIPIELPVPAHGDCTTFDTCLHDRFGIGLVDAIGSTGSVVVAGDSSGLFTFDDQTDWTTLVRIVNGCAFNDHFWVFAAATTDVGFDLTVTDTTTSENRSYTNPLGGPAPAILDTEAFATCP